MTGIKMDVAREHFCMNIALDCLKDALKVKSELKAKGERSDEIQDRINALADHLRKTCGVVEERILDTEDGGFDLIQLHNNFTRDILQYIEEKSEEIKG